MSELKLSEELKSILDLRSSYLCLTKSKRIYIREEVEALESKITELEKQIEAMKCCGCCHFNGTTSNCIPCVRSGENGYEDNWRLKKG